MPRYGLYNDKNPLAMSFLLTAKGLVFTISQQMLQASQPQKKRWKNEQNILRNDIKAYRRNSVPNWKPLTKKPKNYGLNKSKKTLKRISQKRCIEILNTCFWDLNKSSPLYLVQKTGIYRIIFSNLNIPSGNCSSCFSAFISGSLGAW